MLQNQRWNNQGFSKICFQRASCVLTHIVQTLMGRSCTCLQTLMGGNFSTLCYYKALCQAHRKPSSCRGTARVWKSDTCSLGFSRLPCGWIAKMLILPPKIAVCEWQGEQNSKQLLAHCPDKQVRLQWIGSHSYTPCEEPFLLGLELCGLCVVSILLAPQCYKVAWVLSTGESRAWGLGAFAWLCCPHVCVLWPMGRCASCCILFAVHFAVCSCVAWN